MILANGKMSKVEANSKSVVKTFTCPLMFLKEKFFYENFPEFAPEVICINEVNMSIATKRLKSWRDIKDTLSNENKRNIAEQLILKLKLLWDKGYIHGDVHMDNIVFNKELSPVLIDFEWFHHRIHDKFENDIDIKGHSFVNCFDGSYRSVKNALNLSKEDALEVIYGDIK